MYQSNHSDRIRAYTTLAGVYPRADLVPPKRRAEFQQRVQRILNHSHTLPDSLKHRLAIESFSRVLLSLQGCVSLVASCLGIRLGSDIANIMLPHAAALGRKTMVAHLLKVWNADVNYQNGNGDTALHLAIKRKRFAVADMLLRSGAKLYPNKAGVSPLGLACMRDMALAVPVFKNNGVDLNRPEKIRYWNRFYLGWHTNYIYPISYALCKDKPQVLRALLKAGAKIDVPLVRKKTLTWREVVKQRPDAIGPRCLPIMIRAIRTHTHA